MISMADQVNDMVDEAITFLSIPHPDTRAYYLSVERIADHYGIQWAAMSDAVLAIVKLYANSVRDQRESIQQTTRDWIHANRTEA